MKPSKAGGLQVGMLMGGAMLTLAVAATSGASAPGAALPADEGPAAHVSAPTAVDAGRYLVIVGGCNDCHTAGWGESNGSVPEGEWLTGVPVGFRGPWGTSYPGNLRLAAQATTEDAWVARMKAGQGLPPMPWMNAARMADQDLRAIYRYLKALGPAGEATPTALGPGVEPSTPYFVFEPVMPEGMR